jgi:hypothetical protein
MPPSPRPAPALLDRRSGKPYDPLSGTEEPSRCLAGSGRRAFDLRQADVDELDRAEVSPPDVTQHQIGQTLYSQRRQLRGVLGGEPPDTGELCRAAD